MFVETKAEDGYGAIHVRILGLFAPLSWSNGFLCTTNRTQNAFLAFLHSQVRCLIFICL